MPLVDMRDMLKHACHNSYAVGGFELLSLDFLEAVIQAAESCRAPVILNVVEPHFEHYDFECVIAAAEKAARRATVPIALHLDHCHSWEMAVRAINLGCNSLMLDAGHEPFASNVAQTRKVVEMVHACGMCVEGELGYDTGLIAVETQSETGDTGYTSVEEAKAFVARTEVDCLAVSIGTRHGPKHGRIKLDIERLKRIHDAVEVPLVIHGGSGLSDEQYRKLINHGVARINYSTALADIAADQIRTNLRNHPKAAYTGLVSGMREAIQAEVERCMRMWGSAGRAAEVLVQCRSLSPIEHVIVYNIEGAADSEVENIMAHGRETLGRIPGVRRVFTGWAVSQSSRYRCCWLVEFVHEKVIDTYRDHPDHAAFANQLFRPIAGDRITIDFAEVSGQTDSKVVNGKFRARASGAIN
jgi:fructose-bisphosphate aldolase class II